MIYSEQEDEARRFAEDAIAEMDAVKVAATPPNFAIWYDHVSGRNPALSRILDQVRTKNIPLTEDRNREIFGRYSSFAEAEGETGSTDQVDAIAAEIAEALSDVGKSTEKYGDALASASGSLDSAQSNDDKAAIIKSILSETRAMDNRVKELQDRMQESQDEIAQLRENLELSKKAALTDGLTGLANRRSFDETLTTMSEAARAEGTSLALVIADVDHFKNFNDVYGHQMGDQVLRLVGQTLKNGTKGRDVAARYSGEEFALILLETNLKGAAAVAENLRQTLASRKIAKKGAAETITSVTMSFGVTEYLFGESLEQFIARADAHLYFAKQSGRNQVSAGMNEPQIRKAS